MPPSVNQCRSEPQIPTDVTASRDQPGGGVARIGFGTDAQVPDGVQAGGDHRFTPAHSPAATW